MTWRQASAAYAGSWSSPIPYAYTPAPNPTLLTNLAAGLCGVRGQLQEQDGGERGDGAGGRQNDRPAVARAQGLGVGGGLGLRLGLGLGPGLGLEQGQSWG